MTEEEIAELRSRIDQVEEEFGRRANILLSVRSLKHEYTTFTT